MGQSKVLYAIGRVFCTPIFKLFYRYKPINNHTIPEKGGFIVASNHLSFSDPVLLGLCQKRRLYFMAKSHNVIMDGRDIGTVVLPEAKVKIFLTASPEARAQRRYKELCEKGMDVKYEDILNDVITRDYNDSHRETAPLKPAEGCVTVDTTELDFEQSVEKIISVIKENI